MDTSGLPVALAELGRAARQPCPIKCLRTIPDGTSSASDATDWIVTQFMGVYGMGLVSSSLPECFLRLLSSDALPALCASVAANSTIVAGMTAAEAAIGSPGGARTARLVRLATALWLALGPLAGGGGMDAVGVEAIKRIAKAVMPFRPGLLAQVTARGHLERAIAALAEAYLAGAAPADDSAPPTDARALLATPLAGILRAAHQWPSAGPANAASSLWTASGFAPLRAAVAIIRSTTAERHAAAVTALVRACVSGSTLAEHGLEGASDLVAAGAGLPRTVALEALIAALAPGAGASEAAEAGDGAASGAGSASGAVAAPSEEAVAALAAAITAASAPVAAVACGHLLSEALCSAVEALSSHPAALCAALEASPGARHVIQSLLHLRLARRRGASHGTALHSASRAAVALALAAAPPAASLLPDGAAAAAFAGPLALLGAANSAADAAAAAPAAAGDSCWDTARSIKAVTDAVTAAVRAMPDRSELRIPAEDTARRIVDVAGATPRTAPTGLPWPGAAAGPASAPAAPRRALAWTLVADCLPVRDVVSLSKSCRPLAALLLLPDTGMSATCEQAPAFAVPRDPVKGKTDGNVTRAGVPGTAMAASTISTAMALCEREKVSPPPELTTPPGPLRLPAPRQTPTSPCARLYWARRVASMAVASPAAADGETPLGVIDAAVAVYGGPPAGEGGAAVASASAASSGSASGGHFALQGVHASPGFPTPFSSPPPDARDPAALFTGPARDGRTAGGGLLGGAVELAVRCTDVIDACVARLAGALVRAKAAGGTPPPGQEPEAVARGCFRAMHDATAGLSAACWLGVGVAVHGSVVAELYSRMKGRGAAGGAAASARDARPDDPLALLRALAIVAEQWTGRRLRGDRTRMAPPAAAEEGLYRATVGACRGMTTRLVPALAESDCPKELSLVLVPSEHQRADGRVEAGSVGHPALSAALVRLLLARALPDGEIPWVLTQVTVGASVVPAVAGLPREAQTATCMIQALLASVALDCELMRRSGGEHFGAAARPGERHPLQMAASIYTLACSALTVVSRVFPGATLGGYVDESVAAFRGLKGPGGKAIQPVKAQIVFCLSNATECFLRLHDPRTAGRLACAALALDPTHAKTRSRLQRVIDMLSA